MLEEKTNSNEMRKLVNLYVDFCKLYKKLFNCEHKEITLLRGCFLVFFSYKENDNEYLTLGRIDIEAIRKELIEIEKDYIKRGLI